MSGLQPQSFGADIHLSSLTKAINLSVVQAKNAILTTLGVKIVFEFRPATHELMASAAKYRRLTFHVLGYDQIDRAAIVALEFTV
jgi:hypothetical protein